MGQAIVGEVGHAQHGRRDEVFGAIAALGSDAAEADKVVEAHGAVAIGDQHGVIHRALRRGVIDRRAAVELVGDARDPGERLRRSGIGGHHHHFGVNDFAVDQTHARHPAPVAHQVAHAGAKAEDSRR